MQAHNYTDTASTVLATTDMATYSFQDGHVGVQMSARYGSILPVTYCMPTSCHDGWCDLCSAVSAVVRRRAGNRKLSGYSRT